MVNNPAVSVLMSAYNVEKYIGEAIDSILNQTFIDFEFIIVDDASTDKTLAAIKNYSDSRIRIIRNESNLKLAASLNKGLKIARGKYIVRMDADDISHLERIEKLYQYMEKNPEISVAGTQMKVFGREGGIREFELNDNSIKAGIIWTSPMPHATVIMRLEVIFKHNLFYDESFPVGQDWKFWYDMKNYVKFSNLPEVLYYYRIGDQNVTKKYSGQSAERYIVMYSLVLEELKISFTDQDLQSHLFIIGHFSIQPSLRSIRQAHAWLLKLISHNKKVRIYDARAFEIIAKRQWAQLFYKITESGWRNVATYFLFTGISAKHFLYYTKYLLNQLTGRK